MAATIWDGADSEDYGVVSVDPVRTAPIDGALPRVVISSRELRYTDAGDPIPVWLTLYNPGEARTVTLQITWDGEPWDGSLAVPAATQVGDGWEIALPENGVWFEQIDESSYDGTTVADHAWEATMTDAETGEPIGVPSVARYLFQPAGG